MTKLDMTENTLQFIIKIFGIVVALILLAVAGTYVALVLHDGNAPIVSEAFNDLVNLGQWCIITMGGIIVGKPLTSGIGQFMAQKNAPVSDSVNLLPGQSTPT